MELGSDYTLGLKLVLTEKIAVPLYARRCGSYGWYSHCFYALSVLSRQAMLRLILEVLNAKRMALEILNGREINKQ